ncbi:MAG: sigma 54-interacting transcriptional regulator [Spirochaetaceae bacterium]
MFTAHIDSERLKTLIEINLLINSDVHDGKTLLTRILESATRLSVGEASSILLVNPENDTLYFEVALGTKGQAVQQYSLKMGEGIAGWVAQNNTGLIVNDVDSDERFASNISRKVGFSTTSILAVPMRVRDRCIGVIEIINKKGDGQFTNDDLQWLEVFANQAALALQHARDYQKVRNEVFVLKDKVEENRGFHTLIGSSSIIAEKLEVVSRLAATDSSVLITGESGSGKELFAEQIHLRSNRSEGPFIRVNCAALPPDLLESELFGHVKGAFTDAYRDRIGRFEQADGGTIFLDEIGDIPVELQAKLLRVLQNRSFEKVGSGETSFVDVRILAATNKDMEEEVDQGRFREDLYYRLNVLPFFAPPLRERREDIPELAEYFLKRVCREMNKRVSGFTAEAMDLLRNYKWPGNVRELENVIERAVVLTSESYIQGEDLLLKNRESDNESFYTDKPLKEAINDFKKTYVHRVLVKHNWNRTEAAQHLDIQRTYLSKLVKELGLRD